MSSTAFHVKLDAEVDGPTSDGEGPAEIDAVGVVTVTEGLPKRSELSAASAALLFDLVSKG